MSRYIIISYEGFGPKPEIGFYSEKEAKQMTKHLDEEGFEYSLAKEIKHHKPETSLNEGKHHFW